jgi:small subunit ribosomal protein S17
MSQVIGHRRRLRGRVISDRAVKTITVEVVRSFHHPKYGKMVRKKRRVHAHDEARAAHVGDTVEIMECRPLSRTKCWRLLRVVERNPEQEPAAAATAAPAPVAPGV